MECVVKIKDVYGKPTVYPVNDTAKLLAGMVQVTQVGARLTGVLRVDELALVETRGLGEGLLRRFGLRRGLVDVARCALGQWDAGSPGKLLQRIREVEPLGVAQPGECITRLRAAETVVAALVRVDHERRTLLLVEGTEPLKQLAGAAQGDLGADEFGDVDPRLDRVDDRVGHVVRVA